METAKITEEQSPLPKDRGEKIGQPATGVPQQPTADLVEICPSSRPSKTRTRKSFSWRYVAERRSIDKKDTFSRRGSEIVKHGTASHGSSWRWPAGSYPPILNTQVKGGLPLGAHVNQSVASETFCAPTFAQQSPLNTDLQTTLGDMGNSESSGRLEGQDGTAEGFSRSINSPTLEHSPSQSSPVSPEDKNEIDGTIISHIRRSFNDFEVSSRSLRLGIEQLQSLLISPLERTAAKSPHRQAADEVLGLLNRVHSLMPILLGPVKQADTTGAGRGHALRRTHQSYAERSRSWARSREHRLETNRRKYYQKYGSPSARRTEVGQGQGGEQDDEDINHLPMELQKRLQPQHRRQRLHENRRSEITRTWSDASPLPRRVGMQGVRRPRLLRPLPHSPSSEQGNSSMGRKSPDALLFHRSSKSKSKATAVVSTQIHPSGGWRCRELLKGIPGEARDLMVRIALVELRMKVARVNSSRWNQLEAFLKSSGFKRRDATPPPRDSEGIRKFVRKLPYRVSHSCSPPVKRKQIARPGGALHRSKSDILPPAGDDILKQSQLPRGESVPSPENIYGDRVTRIARKDAQESRIPTDKLFADARRNLASTEWRKDFNGAVKSSRTFMLKRTVADREREEKERLEREKEQYEARVANVTLPKTYHNKTLLRDEIRRQARLELTEKEILEIEQLWALESYPNRRPIPRLGSSAVVQMEQAAVVGASIQKTLNMRGANPDIPHRPMDPGTYQELFEGVDDY